MPGARKRAASGSPRFRPLERSDAPRMLEWVSVPEVAENIGLRRQPSLRGTEDWIAAARESEETSAHAIEVAGEHVGNVILDRIDRQIGAARLSIYIGRDRLRGAGIGTAAVRHALATAFDELGLNKVWLIVHCANEPAIRVYRKCGFEIEGTHRQEFLLRKRLVDCFYMGILASEYRARRGRS